MNKTLLTLVTMFTIPLYAAEYTEVRHLKLETSGLDSFYADTGAGYLKITGNDEINQILVKATIRVDYKVSLDKDDAEEYIADKLIFKLNRSGSKAKLVVDFENDLWSFSKVNRRVDLDIQVPSNLYLNVDDGSGFITITKMNKGILIDDGSGTIELTHSSGNITIDDGSGNIIIKNIQGDISIDDGSGNIDISQITGDITIEDGSGSIEIKDITGSVSVDDGSGPIRVKNVTQNFTLVDDGSGSVHLSGIDGKVRGYNEREESRNRDLK